MKMKRKRHSQAEREQLLSELEQSGESVAAFCRKRAVGVGYATVMNWRAAARRSGTRAGALNFLEVEQSAGTAPQGCEGSVLAAQLALPGGAVLRVYQQRSGGAAAC
jgi:transposase-like protein